MRLKPTKEELAKLRYAENLTIEKIANRCGFAPVTIARLMSRFGLKSLRYNRNLEGMRFGKWLVLERDQKIKGRQFWKCVCTQCTKTIRKQEQCALITGRRQICRACSLRLRRTQKAERWGKRRCRPEPERTIRRKLSDYKKQERTESRRSRGIGFNLSITEFKKLLFGDCFYCGDKPSLTGGKSCIPPLLPHSSIDRIRNNEGYTANNCISCCWLHNQMKGKLSGGDFKRGIISAFRHMLSTLQHGLRNGEKMESEDDKFLLTVYRGIAGFQMFTNAAQGGRLALKETPEQSEAS